MSRSKDPPLWFCLVFLGAGLAVLAWGGRDVVLGLSSLSWKKTPGLVTSSEVKSRMSNDSRQTFRAEVVYEYTVRDRTHTGDQVWFGQHGNGNIEPVRELVRTYPAGREVTVHYDPDDPARSVLRPGLFASTWIIPGVGLLFSAGGAYLFYLWWKSRN